MAGVKITKEIHAKVRETLKTNGIITTAKLHKLSPQSVSRIKRGGRSLLGYKRALADDHISFSSVFDSKEEQPEYHKTEVGQQKTTLGRRGILARLGLRS